MGRLWRYICWICVKSLLWRNGIWFKK
jgi:ABC-type transport system, involved in lipoprotein release, permease component